ncbi:MAG TPA: hypothetical protein VG318_16080 [Actinomycetota bacterium]|nr:hypothetical protein [Actinomycetota bacterium]
MKHWSVAVGLGGLRTSGSAADEQVASVAHHLAHLAPAISSGPASLTIRMSVEADDATGAAAAGVTAVTDALDATGAGAATIRELEVVEWSLFEERLDEPNYPELVGITEIAEILSTSRQRASELARTPKFPAAHSELAAGPVWLKPAVIRFASEWDRKPGRPKRASTRRLEQTG